MKTFDRTRRDFEPYGFSCEKWDYERMPRADRHNEIELNLLPDGTMTYLMGGRRITVQGKRLTLFWAATPHQIVTASGVSSYYVATVPLAWFLQWKLPDRFVRHVLAGGVAADPERRHAGNDTLLFEQWIGDMGYGPQDLLKITRIEIEARTRRLALAYCSDPVDRTPALRGRGEVEISKIEKIAAHIAQHYTEPLRLSDIGRLVNLHPNYATTLFRKTFGKTLNEYITDHRISHAQRLLVTTDAKILEIAMASGFNTLSRFNFAFRSACRLTPREYRRMHVR